MEKIAEDPAEAGVHPFRGVVCCCHHTQPLLGSLAPPVSSLFKGTQSAGQGSAEARRQSAAPLGPELITGNGAVASATSAAPETPCPCLALLESA